MEDLRLEILNDILRDKFGGNKSRMARALGKQLPNVSSWFTKRRIVTDKSLAEVCEKLELDYESLLTAKLKNK